MRRSLQSLIQKKNSPQRAVPNRRNFLFGAAAALAASRTGLFARTFAPLPDHTDGPLKIEAVELIELHGRYTDEAGVNRQPQVNPLDIYDDLRHAPYADKPSGSKDVLTTAIYLRIRTAGGIDGLYGPIEKSAAVVVNDELRPFLIGKDALAGEKLWDQMYRSNRHSRDGFFMMAISAVDNTLWDIRGKYFNAPVYRLLGGPTRSSVEMYASCLGFSLEPAAVRTRALAIKNEGYRFQKWFMGYGPGSGPEGMRKNVELVRILRETVGDDTELMFDAYSGWTQNYALEWAHQSSNTAPTGSKKPPTPKKSTASPPCIAAPPSRSPQANTSMAAGRSSATFRPAASQSCRPIPSGVEASPNFSASAPSPHCTTFPSSRTATACARRSTSSPANPP